MYSDILLTERYITITNEGLLPWYFITSPLAEIHESDLLHSESGGHFFYFCLSIDIVTFGPKIKICLFALSLPTDLK